MVPGAGFRPPFGSPAEQFACHIHLAGGTAGEGTVVENTRQWRARFPEFFGSPTVALLPCQSGALIDDRLDQAGFGEPVQILLRLTPLTGLTRQGRRQQQVDWRITVGQTGVILQHG